MVTNVTPPTIPTGLRVRVNRTTTLNSLNSSPASVPQQRIPSPFGTTKVTMVIKAAKATPLRARAREPQVLTLAPGKMAL